MGNTPAKDRQQQVYSEYIRQQQELIYKQQQQINSLYQYNLDNQELQQQMQIPPNINFQTQIPIENQNIPRLPSGKQKLDPYKILNLPKQYDEKTLKKAYLKAAMKTHPDRGGSRDSFQKVSIAYAVLTKKLKEKQNNHSHNDLREMSRDYAKTQESQPMVNVDMRDNFDVNLFNKIYEDNRIGDAYDDGYGSWMQQNQAEEVKMIKGNTKMFQDNFNKDLFNDTFEKYKREQSQKRDQVVEYKDPEVRISMSNQDSLMTLGQGKINDFGGSLDNLAYTDYKQAFTDGSMLIDPSTVDTSGRANSVRGIKSQRSNISYQMTQEDQIRLAKQQALEEKAEKDRVSRLNVYDRQHGEAYERIHSMLLR